MGLKAPLIGRSVGLDRPFSALSAIARGLADRDLKTSPAVPMDPAIGGAFNLATHNMLSSTIFGGSIISAGLRSPVGSPLGGFLADDSKLSPQPLSLISALDSRISAVRDTGFEPVAIIDIDGTTIRARHRLFRWVKCHVAPLFGGFVKKHLPILVDIARRLNEWVFRDEQYSQRDLIGPTLKIIDDLRQKKVKIIFATLRTTAEEDAQGIEGGSRTERLLQRLGVFHEGDAKIFKDKRFPNKGEMLRDFLEMPENISLCAVVFVDNDPKQLRSFFDQFGISAIYVFVHGDIPPGSSLKDLEAIPGLFSINQPVRPNKRLP